MILMYASKKQQIYWIFLNVRFGFKNLVERFFFKDKIYILAEK